MSNLTIYDEIKNNVKSLTVFGIRLDSATGRLEPLNFEKSGPNVPPKVIWRLFKHFMGSEREMVYIW